MFLCFVPGFEPFTSRQFLLSILTQLREHAEVTDLAVRKETPQDGDDGDYYRRMDAQLGPNLAAPAHISQMNLSVTKFGSKCCNDFQIHSVFRMAWHQVLTAGRCDIATGSASTTCSRQLTGHGLSRVMARAMAANCEKPRLRPCGTAKLCCSSRPICGLAISTLSKCNLLCNMKNTDSRFKML